MAPTKKNLRFNMETAAFVTIWRNHIAHPGADNWKKFVLACFERFSDSGKNPETLEAEDPDWNAGPGKGWTDLNKYMFLSERAYSKCIAIKGKLQTKKGMVVELPDGYLRRHGVGRARVTLDDIAAIFEGKDL